VLVDLTGSLLGEGANSNCDDPGNPCGRAAQSDALSNVTDAAGDSAAGEPDLVSMEVGVTAALDNVAFDIRFDAQDFDSATSRATIVIDIDRDPNTGFPGIYGANNDSNLIGNEYLINVGADLGATAQILEWISGETAPADYDLVATVPVTVNSDGYYLNFDLGLLGDDDGYFRYKVLTQRYLGSGYTGIQDYMPDLGDPAGDVNPTGSLVSAPYRFTVTSLPAFGTLTEVGSGNSVDSVPFEVSGAGLIFDPEGTTGSASFGFTVTNTALLTTTGTVFVGVTPPTCLDSKQSCDDGRLPPQGFVDLGARLRPGSDGGARSFTD
jgi:hypothetical protein